MCVGTHIELLFRVHTGPATMPTSPLLPYYTYSTALALHATALDSRCTQFALNLWLNAPDPLYIAH